MTIVLGKAATAAISFLVGAILTGIATLIRSAIKKKKKHDEKEDLVAAGMKWLLRKDILERCDHLLAQDHINLDEWKSLRDENEIYKGLEGNGDAELRMNLVKERIKKQEVDSRE